MGQGKGAGSRLWGNERGGRARLRVGGAWQTLVGVGLQHSAEVLLWMVSVGRGTPVAAQVAAKEIPRPQPPSHRSTFSPLPPVICKQQAPELEPAAALPPLAQPPLAPAAPIPPAQGTPSMDELIQQSQWNLQQQEQHLLALRQVRGLLLLFPSTPSALRRPRALPFSPSCL